jgi:predicted Rossmann fold nucleotide-binding protein DprA/Smf involved in DNA uptake
MRPGDLLEMSAEDLLGALDLPTETVQRLVTLLSRGGQLAFEVEHLSSRGIWLLSRADDDYPKLLKDRLRATSPPVLYCSGSRGLLASDGLAVVGSRDADDAGIAFARSLGERCARQDVAVVSGAARGTDWMAMTGALDAGGSAVGVLADPLERMIKRQDVRRALSDEQLLLLTAFHPSARWHAGNAMRRNRLVYALARAAVVVASAEGSGGTWGGALENLKHRWVPLFVRDDDSRGYHGLVAHGAIPLHASSAPDDVRDLFVPAQTSLLDVPSERPARERAVAEEAGFSNLSVSSHSYAGPAAEEPTSNGEAPADLFFTMVWSTMAGYLVEPRRPEEVAETFDVSIAQVRTWMARAVDAGWAEKATRPVRYVANGDHRHR